MAVFKFSYNPFNDYESADEENSKLRSGYAEVAVSGGHEEMSVHEVLTLFAQFLNGCGYVVDLDRLHYAAPTYEEIQAERKKPKKKK